VEVGVNLMDASARELRKSPWVPGVMLILVQCGCYFAEGCDV
jgi:hypothetical protein